MQKDEDATKQVAIESEATGEAGGEAPPTRKSSKESGPKRKSSKESAASKGSKGSKDSKKSKGSKGSKGSAEEPKGSKGSKLSSVEEDVEYSGDQDHYEGAECAEEEQRVSASPQRSTETRLSAFGAVAVEVDGTLREEGFKAEPLHVRYLCKAEHRRAVGEIKAEEKKWDELQAELEDENTSDDRRQELEEERTRLRYNNRLRQLRFERLSELNPRTHEEFPQQLITAARDGDSNYVKLAYESKVDMNVQDQKLLVTPLIMATISNKINVMKLLLQLKADPRLQDCNSATCVHYAVQLDHVHALAALMDANPGQDWDTLTMKDSRSMSPVDYARRPERKDCLRLMQNRLGGPIPVVWQVFKGWLGDKANCCRPEIVKKEGQKSLKA